MIQETFNNIQDLKFSIPNSEENRKFLKGYRYIECSGSCAYDRKWLTVLPFKKTFYQDNVVWHIKLPNPPDL